MANLAVLGSINVDHLMQVQYAPKAGETLTADNYQVVAGGKGANQAVAAAKLGATVSMIGCIGSDAIGAQMKREFTEIGIDTSGICEITDAATGLAMIYVEQNGENRIGIWPGANKGLSVEVLHRHQAKIEQADLLLMQLETPVEALVDAAAVAKQAGTQVVLNPAPAKGLPEALLNNVDIITPNETEAEILTGVAVATIDDAAKAAKVFHQQFGIGQVLITLGKRGVYLSQDGVGQQIGGFVVDAVDTTAAGDTFNGGFVTALLEGKSTLEAIRFGQAAAALSVTRLGAQSSIPSRAETVAFMQAHID